MVASADRVYGGLFVHLFRVTRLRLSVFARSRFPDGRVRFGAGGKSGHGPIVDQRSVFYIGLPLLEQKAGNYDKLRFEDTAHP